MSFPTPNVGSENSFYMIIAMPFESALMGLGPDGVYLEDMYVHIHTYVYARIRTYVAVCHLPKGAYTV